MLTVSLAFYIDCMDGWMDATILVEMNDQAENRFYCLSPPRMRKSDGDSESEKKQTRIMRFQFTYTHTYNMHTKNYSTIDLNIRFFTRSAPMAAFLKRHRHAADSIIYHQLQSYYHSVKQLLYFCSKDYEGKNENVVQVKYYWTVQFYCIARLQISG